MMLGVGVAALIMVWLGIRLIRRAADGFPAVFAVLQTRTRAIQAIAAGPVEIEGAISAADAPITGLSRVRCVAALTTVRSARGTGKGRTSLGEQRRVEVTRATLRDGSGACELDLEHTEILGQAWVAADMPVADFQEDAPAWASALVFPGATHVTVEEQIIPEGARVLVSGRATALSLAEGAGAPGATPRFRVEGAPSLLLLLAFGGRTRLLLRTIAPVAGGALIGAYLCAFGLVAFAVSLYG
jgi:hypothetical protein